MPPAHIDNKEVVKMYVGSTDVVSAYVGGERTFGDLANKILKEDDFALLLEDNAYLLLEAA